MPVNAQLVGGNLIISILPGSSVKDKSVYVVWDSKIPQKGSEVFLGFSSDRGLTFDKINLSNNAGNSTSPVIAGEEGMLYVAWIDDASLSPDVVAKRSPLPPPVRID